MYTSLFEKIKNELLHDETLSIITLLDDLLKYSYEEKVSDIHLDPTSGALRIRLRIDGVMQHAFDFPENTHAEIISRIKILSRLRTDEHHATQDGRFRHFFPETDNFIDVRVSIIPTYHGENAVLRILSDKSEDTTLENLGFSKSDTEKIISALKKSSGMILATGPTGSGKTTTLYTLLKILNSPDISIITIEDPIEYAILNVEQIQVNPRTGLTFANGLRSILRQDPNVIMVGEIRDSETAHIAVNTALTGHLVLSTLHTNDSATTLPRLLDMGIEEYLVASTINIAVGQRLVRKICHQCKKEFALSKAIQESLAKSALEKIFKNDIKTYKGVGCTYCKNTGYLGRISINEILVADEAIREAIVRRAPASEIKKIAVAHGMTTMLEDGIQKIEAGLTTIEEVLRVIHE